LTTPIPSNAGVRGATCSCGRLTSTTVTPAACRWRVSPGAVGAGAFHADGLHGAVAE
jgi:hypothetical protein